MKISLKPLSRFRGPLLAGSLGGLCRPRSTKAGASTPATPWEVPAARVARGPLNEGRSVNPGYTPGQRVHFRRDHVRSTKAGASTPATHPVSWTHVCATRPRSTKAGASTPATRSPRWGPRRSIPALNEGRSVNPGYTRDAFGGVAQINGRSTKAGASTPATQAARRRTRASS